jgi:hypothetical protein
MNEQNLIPTTQRSEAEVRAMQRKGGINSGKARLAKKHGRELVQALLSMKEADPKVVAEIAASFGIPASQVTKDIAMNARQIDKAIRKADTKAYTAVSKVSGAVDEDTASSANITITIGSEAAAAGAKWSK